VAESDQTSLPSLDALEPHQHFTGTLRSFGCDAAELVEDSRLLYRWMVFFLYFE
jgi:hypothetical protein